MSTFARILAELSDADRTPDDGGSMHEHSPFQLATLADCYSPDSSDSPGAQFLAGIARDVADYVADDADGAQDALDNVEDWSHGIADAAVPIYTHERWQTFVDLAAYHEDVTELAAPDSFDLTGLAGVALYMIAERLVRALADELSDALADDED